MEIAVYACRVLLAYGSSLDYNKLVKFSSSF